MSDTPQDFETLKAEFEKLKAQVALGQKPENRPWWHLLMAERNWAFCVRIFAPTWMEDEKTGKLVLDKKKPPKYAVDVFDRTVSKYFATAEGPSEEIARDNALRAAIKAPKPMTPAQLADMRENQAAAKVQEDKLAEAHDEIKLLRAKVAELTKK